TTSRSTARNGCAVNKTPRWSESATTLAATARPTTTDTYENTRGRRRMRRKAYVRSKRKPGSLRLHDRARPAEGRRGSVTGLSGSSGQSTGSILARSCRSRTCGMFDDAKALIAADGRARIPGISSAERRVQIFERLHDEDVSPEERRRIAAI